ncbi:hypothetical protein [Devosia ginsengisoli]|uniref:hypothetical protein n=1 Tax=Devosia ginsengisoli TaxID=400770 RepID=UPI0026F35BED|nr:hypothetical protein [Devosia ginsengisoli]MCR6672189.1 hypothetical protein [Devosia ginsengisoli]
MEEWISITEAARRLTAGGDVVDRSTLSRYVSQHAEALPTKREGKSNLVEFATLLQHRSENIRLTRRPVEPELPVVGDGPRPPTQISAAARDKEASAALRELELARELRQITSVREVADAAQTAIVMMRNAFERSVDTEAASLALRHGWDERKARLALKDFVQTGVEVFHREMLDRLDALSRAKDAGEPYHEETATLQ